jgi:predicted Zn-dependent protease
LIIIVNKVLKMKKIKNILIVLFFIAVLLNGCSTVPLTGRRQVSFVPESEMVSMGLTNYQTFMKENPPSKDLKNAAVVKEVGNNIAQAVTKYFTENNLQDRLQGYQWEFNLVDEDVANAWCMPGGKVVVYKGILPITVDNNGLAVVMSHEIAHAVARHGNERMSQELLVQFGGMALSEAVSQKPQETQNIFMTAYGAGSQLGVMLPFSREHELEADKLGLIFMAMAGYNPESAVAFWERMEAAGGAKPPEFLSTHPSDANRVNKIKAALPEAMKYYNN